jgi:hypothetical protein
MTKGGNVMSNLMTKRMWIAVLLGIIVFLGLTTGLFFSYRNSSQIDATYLSQQLFALNAQLDTITQHSLGTDNTTAITDIKTKIADTQGKIDQKSGLGSQIWGFFGTDTFKTVGLSLILAVILAAIGGLFKIDNVIEERLRNDRQKRIDAQKECVKLTSNIWNDLYCLVSKVRLYKKLEKPKGQNDDKNKPQTIEEIITELENYTCRADDVVNMWFFDFPILYEIEKANKIKASEIFVYLINVIYDSTCTVAYNIQKNLIKNNDTSLLDSLGVIQDVFENIIHHPIISILKRSEEPIDATNPVNQMTELKTKTLDYLSGLQEWVALIKKYETAHNNSLPASNSKAVIEFRTEIKKYLEWKILTENQNKTFENYEKDFNKNHFKTKFKAIKKEELIENWELKYSQEYLKDFAKWLGYCSIIDEIENRAKLLSTQ